MRTPANRGDPISFSDPLGLEVILRGSLAFQRKIEDLRRSDSTFAAHYRALDEDPGAAYLIYEDAHMEGGFSIGGEDQANQQALRELEERLMLKRTLTGSARVGSKPGGDGVECVVAHEVTHLLGLLNDGKEKLKPGDPLFSRPFFKERECRRAHP